MDRTNNMHFEDIVISSDDGWNSINFKLSSYSKLDNDLSVCVELTMKGSFWDRTTTIEEAELKKDYEVCLPQVILSKNKLKELCKLLENWLGSYEELEVLLSTTIGQELFIFMGIRDDFISEFGKPVFSLKYSSSRMKAEWCFVTDQSCINIFLQSLKAELECA
jgi:hypothetical protein